MDSVGEGEGGKIWENGIETCEMSCMKRDASPGSMHDAGCLGLVHWDDPEEWYGEGGGRRVQDGFCVGSMTGATPSHKMTGNWRRDRFEYTWSAASASVSENSNHGLQALPCALIFCFPVLRLKIKDCVEGIFPPALATCARILNRGICRASSAGGRCGNPRTAQLRTRPRAIAALLIDILSIWVDQ